MTGLLDGEGRLDSHYVPGEHDILDTEITLYRDRYGRGAKGGGWYSFDPHGVHFMGLVNVGSGGRFMGLVDIDNPGGKAGSASLETSNFNGSKTI